MFYSQKIKKLEKRIKNIEDALENDRREKSCAQGYHRWLMKSSGPDAYIGCQYCKESKANYDKKNGAQS